MYQKRPKKLPEWTIHQLHESEMEFVQKVQFLLLQLSLTMLQKTQHAFTSLDPEPSSV